MSASADKQKNNLTCSSEDPSSHGIVVGIFSLMLGALSAISLDGNQYYFIAYDYDTN